MESSRQTDIGSSAAEVMDVRREPRFVFGDWSGSPEALRLLARDLPIYRALSLAPAANLRDFLANVPLLTRQDLRANFPHGFLPSGVRFADLVGSKKVEVVRTSGTSSDRLQVLWADGWW